MARNFSTNQNRHIYVASAYGDVSETSAVGTIKVKTVDNGVNKDLYLIYKGADTVLKSPLIPVKNLSYVKVTKKEDLRKPFKSVLVALDSNVNGGNPVSGQDYILRIAFRQFYGMSDEDQYFKDAAVHATASMKPADFYKKMVDSLNLAFAREVGAHAYTKKDGSVEGSNPYLKFEASSTGITITEKEQHWTRGIETREPVNFEVIPTTIYLKDDNDDVVWGKLTDKTPTKSAVTVGTNGVGNGKDIADLEYFCMGERGDQYREIGFPNYIPTTYLVDPSKEYNVLDLHFAFTDDGVNSYRSEKEITVVDTDGKAIDGIIAEINKAAGTSVKTINTVTSGAVGGHSNP